MRKVLIKNVKLLDGINGDISELKENGKISSVDNLLQQLEYSPAVGIQITRRMALLILKHISIPGSLTTTKAYYDKLVSHYEENIANNSTLREYYETNDELNTNSTNNPFDTLLFTIPSSN